MMQESILALLEANSLLAFLGAFGAGGITAVAPCSLISVPLLVGSAVALNKDLEGRKKVLYTYAFTSLFALGVMISFSILGFIVAKFGGFFSVAPLWAYLIASVLSILIGLIFGLVSTPCASAPLVAIITVAANSGYIYAYGLIFTFALGHSLLLLIAGVSVGFAQTITASAALAKMSNMINKSFALLLIAIGCYFAWQGYLQF
ncbi:MAG: cytochrome c biogenesis protein CcdA [Sulfurimonas sp.]